MHLLINKKKYELQREKKQQKNNNNKKKTTTKKQTKQNRYVRPTKTQISLPITAVWSESSLSAWRNFTSLAIQNAPNEISDRTVRMRRLIWIFAGRTYPNLRCLTLLFIHRKICLVVLYSECMEVSAVLNKVF